MSIYLVYLCLINEETLTLDAVTARGCSSGHHNGATKLRRQCPSPYIPTQYNDRRCHPSSFKCARRHMEAISTPWWCHRIVDCLGLVGYAISWFWDAMMTNTMMSIAWLTLILPPGQCVITSKVMLSNALWWCVKCLNIGVTRHERHKLLAS